MIKGKISLGRIFYAMSRNAIVPEKREYITSESSNFAKDARNLNSDVKRVSNNIRSTMEKHKEYLHG